MPRRFSICALVALCSAAALPCIAQNAATQPAASAPATQAATAPATQPITITWDTAKSHVNETVTVTGPVIGTHTTNDGSHVNLNVGKDYPDTSRFSVYFPAQEGKNPDDLYKGKTVSVTGKIVLYHDVPEIITEAKDITIQK
jgi:hypothetical protein